LNEYSAIGALSRASQLSQLAGSTERSKQGCAFFEVPGRDAELPSQRVLLLNKVGRGQIHASAPAGPLHIDANRLIDATGSDFGGDLEAIATAQRECNTSAVYAFKLQRNRRISV
jgi:hypothetical protein